MVLRASGHANILATHAKTLELTTGTQISPRATCVVGVGLSLDPVPVGLLRGPVRLTIEVDGHRACGHAVINPAHEVSDRVVIRRADSGGPETLAVMSTLSAVDLDRDLAQALARPNQTVTLTVAEESPVSRRPRRALIIVGSGDLAPPSGRLAMLWRHADAIVRSGGEPADIAPDALRDGQVIAMLTPGSGLPGGHRMEALPDRATAWLAAVARRARFVTLNGDELLEVLLAAGLPGSPVRWLGRVDRVRSRDPRFGKPIQPAPVPTVLAVPGRHADAVLGPLAETDPGHPVAVQDPSLDIGTAMEWMTAAGALDAVRTHRVDSPFVVLAERARGPSGDLTSIAWALIDAGVPARTVSAALARFGLDRRDLYAAIARRGPATAGPATGA